MEKSEKRISPERLKQIIEEKVPEEQRAESWEKVKEWYLEDRAEGILIEELLEKLPFLEEIFNELGLI
jgi:hypothetical protein